MQTVDFERSAVNQAVNGTMRAAVYTGASTISVEAVPVPAIGPGEILVRVEACGICHTDLKKIEYNLLPAPRVFGHETAGVVAAVGEVSRGSSRAIALSPSTISPAATAFIATISCMRNARATNGSGLLPVQASRRAADSPNMCG